MNLNIGEGQFAPKEQACFCDSDISLRSVSGGAHANGYLGSVWLRVDGESVEYVRRKPAEGNPAGTPGAKVDASPDLPPPFDSQEEAQRAAGAMLSEAAAALNDFAEQLAAPDPELVGQKMQGLGGRIAAASPALGVDLARDGADAMAYMLCSHGKQRDRIAGASPALGAPTGIDATLAERGSRYGKFEDHSEVSQALKKVVFTKRPRETLATDQVEALEMICHKLGRIVNGDPNYADSWFDIAGYAKLVADRLEGVSR